MKKLFFSNDNSEKIKELQKSFSEQLAEQSNSTDKNIRELQAKVANFEKIFSQIAKNVNDQKSHGENAIRELQDKIDNLSKNNFSQKESLQKIISAKSYDQKLFVIYNNVESKMSVEEIFDDKNFTDLKVVTYSVKEDFVREVRRCFHKRLSKV